MLDHIFQTMGIREILQHLERPHGAFPRETVAEAIAHRAEITPSLLQILENVVRDPALFAEDEECLVHIFAMFLLAKFRETRAYPLLIQIVSTPGETAFDLMGDVVTENLGGILASVSGGDAGGIQALIEDETANEYVRSAAMSGLVTLVAAGLRSRDEVVRYFAGLFGRLERKPGYMWDSLVRHCLDLYPGDLEHEIRQAFEDDLLEPGEVHPDDVAHTIARGLDATLEDLPALQYRLVDDLELEMGWMSAFQPEVRKSAEPAEPRGEYVPAATFQRSGPKIGRNDPCPCGSGRKYKRCCGG